MKRIILIAACIMVALPCIVPAVTTETATTRDPKYPAIWFEAVPKDKVAWWEVPPQAAGPGEVILSKRNELGILSNFANTTFTLDGKTYPGIEGFWQMMLYPESADDPRTSAPGVEWKYTRDQVAQMVGFEAKAAGELASANMKKMGINRVTYNGKRMDYYVPDKGDHYNLIVRATRAKLEQNPEVKRILLATGDLKLRPDHTQPADAPPSWRYFEIYMQLRDELRKSKPALTPQ
ncbi:MAG: NADAR family protein [Candidatus Sumerlaeaceae bacterium]|nr:NADAR family protein [Candidatus Sumerlaeaceae bacterium]